jgi:hypothetical protein
MTWFFVLIYGHVAMTIGPLPADVCMEATSRMEADFDRRYEAGDPYLMDGSTYVERDDLEAGCSLGERPKVGEAL